MCRHAHTLQKIWREEKGLALALNVRGRTFFLPCESKPRVGTASRKGNKRKETAGALATPGCCSLILHPTRPKYTCCVSVVTTCPAPNRENMFQGCDYLLSSPLCCVARSVCVSDEWGGWCLGLCYDGVELVCGGVGMTDGGLSCTSRLVF